MKNQTFGMELEMYDITREHAAELCAAHFGVQARYIANETDVHGNLIGYKAWGFNSPDGRLWKFMRDNSIPASCNEEKCEFVTPICCWDDIPTVQELVRILRKAGAHVEPRNGQTCGIHVHVGLGNHTPRTLRNLVNIVYAKEKFLEDALKIDEDRRERWCKPVEDSFQIKLNKKKPKDMECLAHLWYSECDPYWCNGTSKWKRCAVEHYNKSRYHLLNLHAVWQKGTIEFRAFNATLHAGEVKAYIHLALAISHQALESKSASPIRLVTDNPKYAFRCWLLRLGFIGEEFASTRQHLLKHLDGNSAWRDPDAH